MNENLRKTLLIVESPSKCEKIETYLGKEKYKCLATAGHFRTLSTLQQIVKTEDFPLTSFVKMKRNEKNSFTLLRQHLQKKEEEKENVREEKEKEEEENVKQEESEPEENQKKYFEIVYEVDRGKNRYLQEIEKWLRSGRVREVLLATDDDREGEAIAWHVCDFFGLSVKETARIYFHEITEEALRSAVSMERRGRINMNLVEAQKTRQILDLWVGYTFSPLLWKNIMQSKENPLSAGRCQTPTLKMVYDLFYFGQLKDEIHPNAHRWKMTKERKKKEKCGAVVVVESKDDAKEDEEQKEEEEESIATEEEEEEEEKFVYKLFGDFSPNVNDSLSFSFLLSKVFEDTKEGKEEMMEFFAQNENFEHECLEFEEEEEEEGKEEGKEEETKRKRKTKRIESPKPFHTSGIQQYASSVFGWTGQMTMRVCQELYEEGLITYHRTENRRYSIEFLNLLREFVERDEEMEMHRSAFDFSGSNSFSFSSFFCKMTKEVEKKNGIGKRKEIGNVKEKEFAHEAIRPTKIQLTPRRIFSTHPKISLYGRRLYKIIWQRTLESCAKPYIYRETELQLSSPDPLAVYQHVCHFPIELGWKTFSSTGGQMKKAQEEEEEEEEEGEEEEEEHAENENDDQSTKERKRISSKIGIQNVNEEMKLYSYFQMNKTRTEGNVQPIRFRLKRVRTKMERKKTKEERKKKYVSEGELIHALEKMEIGRPSTFSSLVEKIQLKHYVELVKEIPGNERIVTNYVSEYVPKRRSFSSSSSSSFVISEVPTMIKWGGGKNKLVIQPLGVLVIELLYQYFPFLFHYSYTKESERILDEIANGRMNWQEVCLEKYQELEKVKKEFNKRKLEKFRIVLDESHHLFFGPYGPAIQHVNPLTNEHISFHSLLSNLVSKENPFDIHEFALNPPLLEEIIERNPKPKNGGSNGGGGEMFGEYEGEKMIVRRGKFGRFFVWKEMTFSMKQFGNRPLNNIRMEEMISLIEKKKSPPKEKKQQEEKKEQVRKRKKV